MGPVFCARLLVIRSFSLLRWRLVFFSSQFGLSRVDIKGQNQKSR